jgi:hypothetical protein
MNSEIIARVEVCIVKLDPSKPVRLPRARRWMLLASAWTHASNEFDDGHAEAIADAMTGVLTALVRLAWNDQKMHAMPCAAPDHGQWLVWPGGGSYVSEGSSELESLVLAFEKITSSP